MEKANLMDGESMKGYRRKAHSAVHSYVEMFRRVDSLKQSPDIGQFQNIMLDLLQATDPKLQSSSLTCLIKSGYRRGILIKYKKLLEGFADDEKFKDMIPILIHGSSSVENAQEDTAMETDDKFTKKAKRKETKASIPKLEDDDRADVLPVVIKLL